MTFIWPAMLGFLVLVPLFALVYLRLQQRRKRLAAQYGSFGLVQDSSGRRPGFRRHLPPLLFLIGLAVLIAAVARPHALVRLPSIQGTVMLVFDVSGSMAADDLQPSRIEAAKEAARNFVVRQPEDVLIGVVAFSDNGFAIQPPTSDQNAVLASIDRLAPQRGTALAHGILSSLNTLISLQEGEDAAAQIPQAAPPANNAGQILLPDVDLSSASIVLLTDGENNQMPDPLAAAQAAADRGVRIHTVGVGSTAGAVLQIEGFSVHTRLDEGLLREIARLTGGEYYNAQTEQELSAIYENIKPQLVIKPERIEITSLFAGAGILILLVSGTFSLLWFSRLP